MDRRSQHVFLVMAGLGLDAQMAANTNADAEGHASAGRLHRRDSARRPRQQQREGALLGGWRSERSATVNTVIVGNCGLLPGNIQLLPEAIIDDGVFDIVAFRPNGFFGWVQIYVKLVWENGMLRRSTVGRRIVSMSPRGRALRYLRGSEFTLRLEHPEEFELDGDPFGEAIALKAHVDHLGLNVMVPQRQ